jgi:hypothetical protein
MRGMRARTGRAADSTGRGPIQPRKPERLYRLERCRNVQSSRTLPGGAVCALRHRVDQFGLRREQRRAVWRDGSRRPSADSLRRNEKSVEATAPCYSHLWRSRPRSSASSAPMALGNVRTWHCSTSSRTSWPTHRSTLYNYGSMERDFTYVDDIVEAVVRLCHEIPPSDGETAENGIDSASPAAPTAW